MQKVYIYEILSNHMRDTEGIPPGIICLWSGKASSIPSGWVLCNGETHGPLTTPDLRSRFIIGADADMQEETYGEATALEIIKGGEHFHFISAEDHRPSGQDHPIPTDHTNTDGAHTHEITFKNNADLRPKWYALCFIMYIGFD
jgi:hypothetical protein